MGIINNPKSVVVVGGGIGGIQSALDLADMNIHVHLIEKKPCIGGRMAQLDKTFPTNDCSICILAPKLSECYRHPNITLHTLSEIKKINGEKGNYCIEILKKPRFVKEDACINCGDCAEKCPMRVEDEFDRGLRHRKAIYLYYLQGVPAVMTIDPENCLWFTKEACRICEKNCDKDAIDFDQQEEVLKLDNIGSIIVSVGYNVIEDFLPLKHYGYKEFRNVITALEFERLLSASGPQGGHIKRLSDGKKPKKIAYIQCVGSRDKRNKDYCSSICCMYTSKEAMIAYEHDNEVESYIFYVDIRAGGKGFNKFIERGEKEYNIKYTKSKVPEISIDKKENPIIKYENIKTSEIELLKVDLVVLATCIVPSKGIRELANILSIQLDKFDFIKTDSYFPTETSREGIFTCGCAHEPMDIPQTVAEASAAASSAAEIIKGGEF